MKTELKIDFVSDISCPWCVIGLKSLKMALAKLADDVAVDLHFQPFELNPQMGPQGEDIGEYVAKKFSSKLADIERNREAARARGAELGFIFEMGKRGRVYNTFDAHRLLHWARAESKQEQLKEALFTAYFTNGKDPSNHAELVHLSQSVGLDGQRATEILASDEYMKEVREREAYYTSRGIRAVPSIIINDEHLIQGGQRPETIEQALRQLA
jgi:predicted DsbA family dithiol-disulfide isomerase